MPKFKKNAILYIIKKNFFSYRCVVKKTWKIVRRVLLTLGLTVYILVALVNYSVVQSYLGALAGSYFSKEWGGKVYIGSLHAMPFDHLIADDILWVSPTGDTLLVAEKLSVSFESFPYSKNRLELDRVCLKNAYYHFATKDHKTNLQFLIDYYRKERKKKKRQPFTVKVNMLELDNVHYKMDLPDKRKRVYAYGVQIPYMEFYNINAKIKDITVINDDVTCTILNFSTDEKSGFKLNNLYAYIHVNRYNIVAQNLVLKTPYSHIAADAKMSYNGWKGMKGYVHTVQHEVTLKPGTHVDMSDAAYWAPILWDIDATADVHGSMTGTIDSMVADLDVRWGDNSSALVAGTIVGLPKIGNTVFNVDIERLLTSKKDLEPLLERVKLKGTANDLLDAMGDIELTASLQGGIQEHAVVNILADCELGRIRADAMLHRTPAGYRIALDANSDKLNLSPIKTPWLSQTGFDISMDGMWRGNLKELNKWQQKLDLAIDSRLTNSVIKGHNLSSANLSGVLKDGHLSATLESTDSMANLNATVSADLKGEERHYEADIDIVKFDMGVLPKPFTTHLVAKADGNDIDNLNGKLTASNISYGDLHLDNIDLNVESDPSGKEIQLKSDLADATIKGRFSYQDLPLTFRHFGHMYLPELFNNVEDISVLEALKLADDAFSYRIRWKDDGTVLHTLVKNVSIAQGTIIDGSYNFGEQLKLVLKSDSISIGSLRLEDIGASGHPMNNKYELQVDAQSLSIGKIKLLEWVTARVGSSPELTTMELKWGGSDQPTRGDLMLALEGNEITVTKPWFYVGETQWTLATEQTTIEKGPTGKLMFNSERLRLESQRQRIDAHLQLGGLPTDCVELDFHRFNLDLLSDVLLQNSPVNVAGDINGHFSLHGLDGTPWFNANLTVDSCLVNGQQLGDVQLNSNWNSELNKLNLKLESEQLQAAGWLGLGKKNPDLNFKVDFYSFELALAAPLLSAFSSRFEGQLHGNFDITGTLQQPLFVGNALVENGALKIDITDVTYHFADSLQFQNNVIILNDFDILDPLGNKATVDGTIELTRDKKVMMDIDFKTDNLLVLNKKNGDQFYGKLLAAADGTVTGPTERLDINIRARTNPGCDLTVPISFQQRVKTQNYITFVSDKVEDNDEVTTKKKKQTNYNLELDLSITPDAKINLPMDFRDVSVNVGATGAGELHMNLSGNNTAQMMGNYEITSGSMRVGLLSVYEKRFTIENGSSLNFQGNVPDARFDLRAVYSQRANLSTLTGSLSTVDNTQKYLQVENIIAISGTLNNPNISFDIRLPNADQSVEEEVFAYIDRNSERDMLNQTLSLLISGKFYNVNSESASGSPLDIVTSFVGNSLTDMVQFVDVNIDYKSATEQTNEQFDVNISKDWGRWYLESTLGYGGESRELDASTVNGTVLDALIGYRLSPVFHLFAYNRTNTNDYTRVDLPYKQGAGLKLTKDFDRWSDLFKRKKKKKTN